MMRLLSFFVVLATCCAGCAGHNGVDWSQLVIEAAPTFKQGQCGVQLEWHKVLAVHKEIEVQGQVVIKKRCAKKLKSDPPQEH